MSLLKATSNSSSSSSSSSSRILRAPSQSPTRRYPLKPPLLNTVVHFLFSIATTILLYLVSLGPIPQHVGFVMDGNRRYARGLGKEVSEGHGEGFAALKRTLEICLRLRIRAVSVYAFAIDNFSRSENEVSALMRLAKDRLAELCQHGELLEEYGVKIKFIGQISLFPPDVQQAVREMEEMTKHHKNGVLNVCAPYSSRDEITTSLQDTVQTVLRDSDSIRVNDIKSEDILRRLGTSKAVSEVDRALFSRPDESGKLDILVRTSNVKRLSDFMMWQASQDTQLHFVNTFWPEFGLSDMIPILLGWQQKQWIKHLGWS
ncbi:di-trans,poly-cis-decaprenylcistransferase [Kwoniella dejecticola CBS 10117]|uniref:Alkyl transferase n=1 Tax=Kwoniella dejecticola CBS 10117 TaxID=1296121 RepID=A0A1A6A3D7_9TREE|nr:di-trans,poly-cis-decaprenylcistransferase [Kwoniella dejecticola CBS 10117]OBR84578.1 di-trans,poly-cis-decaprenylcistransferase [Kwoniella dejecticola CBS 10117]